MPARPNIILIECDSMDGRALGCMGHRAALTPNLDKLAEEGVLFRNTYCNSPLCVPSRASMFSGLHVHRCEAWNNHKGLESKAPVPAAPVPWQNCQRLGARELACDPGTFMSGLQAGGHQVFVSGKTDYISGKHSLRARMVSWTRAANVHLPVWAFDAPRVEDSSSPRTRGGNSEWDWPIVDECVKTVRAAARTSEPFFVYCGIRGPHPALLTTKHWYDRIDPDKIELPGEPRWTHPTAEFKRAVTDCRRELSAAQIREMRRVYLAMVAEVDSMAGQFLQAVKETGLSDRTYVLFTSDHGEMVMDLGQTLKSAAYEPSVRVPLLVSGPGLRRGAREERFASLVDLHPTLMDLAGLPRPQGLDGTSLLPRLLGKPAQGPNEALAQFHGENTNTGIFMLRQDDWKHIAYAGYPPQLFNLRDDPGELVDLAPARKEISQGLDRRLRELVDYEEVDARAKAHDKAAYHAWRKTLSDADYHKAMSGVYAGWNAAAAAQVDAWAKAPY